MPRFVIHRHEVPASLQRPSHWDVMLEADAPSTGASATGSAGAPANDSGTGSDSDRARSADREHRPDLLTWAVAELPTGGGTVPAERLDNHRREYLDYQGPISGHRGSIRRWDTGSLTWLAQDDDFIHARVVGTRWIGIISLRRKAVVPSAGPDSPCPDSPCPDSPCPDSPCPPSTEQWSLEFAADG